MNTGECAANVIKLLILIANQDLIGQAEITIMDLPDHIGSVPGVAFLDKEIKQER